MRLSLLLVFIVAGCGGAQVSLKAPPVMERMHRVGGADVTASFPGYEGPVYALHGDGGAHWFGVLTRTKDDVKDHLLVGISPHRVWSDPLAVEAADREVTRLELLGSWLGDLQRDGAPDLLIHLRASSRQKEGGRTHVRDVVRLYSLGKELRQTWLGTIALRGSSEAGCRRYEYDYRALPTFQEDKSGGVRMVDVGIRTILETCAPTLADCRGPVVCGMSRTDEAEAFIWDPDLGAFRAEDANEARFTVPDVSFQ